jgi:hypothetical protein
MATKPYNPGHAQSTAKWNANIGPTGRGWNPKAKGFGEVKVHPTQRMADDADLGGILGTLGSVAGTVGGMIYGGPMGGQVGGMAGGKAGTDLASVIKDPKGNWSKAIFPTG